MKFIPVTTFGGRFPIDDLVRPHLPALVDTVMVSHQSALQLPPGKPPVKLMIDSGGFASRHESTRLHPRVDHASMTVKGETLTPQAVLALQEQHASTGFTLDFMVLPEQDWQEQKRRYHYTILNALWAIKNRQKKNMRLYASLQTLCPETAKEAVRIYRDARFDGVGVGALVPKARDLRAVQRVLETVLEESGPMHVHAFGLGTPELIRLMQDLGVHSSDSSSYVQWAAYGWNWQGRVQQGPMTQQSRATLAIQNLQELLSITDFDHCTRGAA